MKCKIIDVFDTSWGKVAIIEFPDKLRLKIGDRIRNSNNDCWKITGISNSNAPVVSKYKDRLKSLYVYNCTIEPINHADNLQVNAYLEFISSSS